MLCAHETEWVKLFKIKCLIQIKARITTYRDCEASVVHKKDINQDTTEDEREKMKEEERRGSAEMQLSITRRRINCILHNNNKVMHFCVLVSWTIKSFFSMIIA